MAANEYMCVCVIVLPLVFERGEKERSTDDDHRKRTSVKKPKNRDGSVGTNHEKNKRERYHQQLEIKRRK
jgi:hypothetical protein